MYIPVVAPPAKKTKPHGKETAVNANLASPKLALGQGVHNDEDTLPIEGLYVPAGQAMQDEGEMLPTDGLYVPAGQAMQDEEEILPTDGLYVPAGQTVQDV